MKNNMTVESIKAKTFIGLMAAEGQVPGAVSSAVVAPEFLDILHDEIHAVAAPGMNFFELMVSQGMMKPIFKEPSLTSRLRRIRIVRPYNLGGDLPQTA